MNIGSTIDPFWVLYLVNVFQPVTRETLDAEAKSLLKAIPGRSQAIDVAKWLPRLVGAELVMTRSDSLYMVTSLGLERLSEFKFGQIRDKNRLFMLKKRFKED